MKSKINNEILCKVLCFDILCFDIFLELIKHLDIIDICNLFMVTKCVYKKIYLNNKDYFNKFIINKILKYFNFYRRLNIDNIENKEKYPIENKRKDEISNICCILMKTYKHFKYHRYSYKIDFLLYMLENDLDNDILFEYYANVCDYNSDYRNRYNYISNVNVNNVSLSDIMYIFKYSNNNQLNIILRNFTLPIKILDFIIDDTLIHSYKDKKIFLVIDYMFYKYCFGFFDNVDKIYINRIIINLIKHKKTNILKFFLQKKKIYFKGSETLDYQEIVNEIVSIQDKTHLQLILNELKYDNRIFENKSINKVYIVIKSCFIKNICKQGNFKYLKYLTNEILGGFINYKLYIESICQGLEILMRTCPEKIKTIRSLSNNFDDKSKYMINNYLKQNIF